MLKRELGVLFLVGCFILSSIPAASCRTPAPMIYVAGDGSGDFNCDGKDDHVQINQALKFVAENSAYTTVHLKGPFTYVVDDTLLIGSNTILEGDSNAVIKLTNSAGWITMKPLMQQMSSSGNNNITIRGFEVDVNHDGNSELAKGKGYYNVIYFMYTSNVTVNDMYMHDGHGDGLRIKYGSNIQFYNNTIYKLGHDGLFAIECTNVEAWNNTITCRTNSALRVWNTNNVKFHDNFIDSFYHWSAGGPGIQVERSKGDMTNIEIYDNVITNTYGPGIWLIGTAGAYDKSLSSVYIHHNIFYDSGTNPSIEWVGGVLGSGFHNVLIENNVFDGVHNAAVVNMYSTDTNAGPSGTGFTTTVRNNIMVNTVPRTTNAAGTGYGVINRLTSSHTIVLENNCLYNNTLGNYKNVKSTTDIYVNPLFAGQSSHDYHLKSVAGRWNGNTWVTDSVSSQCIDAGFASSDYSNEPEDNGNRINIGAFGNTKYASKSGTLPIINNPPVMNSIPDVTVEAGKSLTFTVSASDVDGNTLAYSASGIPSGAVFDSKSGIFSWTTAAGQEGTYSITFEVSDGKLKDSATASISVVKQESPSPVAGKVCDNRLREASPEVVYQDSSFIDVGGMSSGKYRDVVWFDLSEYNVSAEISSANLSFRWYYPAGSSRPQDTVIEVYRPASTWNPSYVSWNKRDKGIAWKNAGGDWYDKNGVSQGSTPYATITLKGSTLPDNRYYELNVTDLVKEYTSGKYENTGFLMKARTESNNYIAFYSSDCGNESQKPKLSVAKKTPTMTVPLVTVNVTVTGSKNNRLREASPYAVYENSSFIDVGGMSSGRYRDVMLFNLSEYTGSTDVNNATLSLYWYYPAGGSRPEDTIIEVYRPASAWNPSYVSWNNRISGVSWKNPGGDWYDKNGVLQGNTPYATMTLKGSTLPDNRYYELNVTDLVKEYTSGKYENTGFMIKARTESNNYIAFYSSAGSISQVPKLQLVYT
ncbi:DNRLRE domain-containing protein [Methanosarcina sp. DH2]|uniref:disaggregatase related repeat-containing protein n=1 Tax=Methanosarcina sp. DH2 TaxID=2605639 RepID=UPI001E4326C7|nr:disaggregatase related repeat-containing protein [Methanosarcina sp. DH2]MCC4768755.1 DNRLRE domain-containing protein [Methanosarcina sp. DH2]